MMASENRSRSDCLRARNRKVFGWSMAAAVALHVVVLAFSPWFHVRPLDADRAPEAVGVRGANPLFVEVLFGPPQIRGPDGTVSVEPPDRVLEASEVLNLPAECAELGREGGTPLQGRVRLRVAESGKASVVELTTTTGNACADEVITDVADALWYHWLPDDRYPAPVDLVQPVTLVKAIP